MLTTAIEASIRRAHEEGARIVLNAAPKRPVSVDLLRSIDLLIINEDEAVTLAAPLGWPAAPNGFAAAGSAAA